MKGFRVIMKVFYSEKDMKAEKLTIFISKQKIERYKKENPKWRESWETNDPTTQRGWDRNIATEIASNTLGSYDCCSSYTEEVLD
tara:strand:- start:296 stop:550 length:255 start_codon:yes stop_codon:yes gene_type:complete